MTKRDKDLIRFVRNPQSFSWDNAVTILTRCGFTVRKQKTGSHWNVYHAGMPGVRILPVPIRNNRPTSPYYFTMLARLIRDWLAANQDVESDAQ